MTVLLRWRQVHRRRLLRLQRNVLVMLHRRWLWMLLRLLRLLLLGNHHRRWRYRKMSRRLLLLLRHRWLRHHLRM